MRHFWQSDVKASAVECTERRKNGSVLPNFVSCSQFFVHFLLIIIASTALAAFWALHVELAAERHESRLRIVCACAVREAAAAAAAAAACMHAF